MTKKRVKNYAYPTLFADSVHLADSIPRHREFAQESGALIGPGLVVSDTDDLFSFRSSLVCGQTPKANHDGGGLYPH